MKNLLYFFISIAFTSFIFIQCKPKTSASETASSNINKDSVLANNTGFKKADSMTNVLKQSEEERLKNVTSIKFDKEVYDFGECTEGDKITKKIEFTNTGKLPLVITQAYGSCGCTVPKYNKEPLAPGKKGQLEVQFDSKGKAGANTKSIIIEANTNPQVTTVSFSIKVNESKKKKGWFN